MHYIAAGACMHLPRFATLLPLVLVLASGCGGAPDETQSTSQSGALSSGIVCRWPPIYTGPTWSTTDLVSNAQLPFGITTVNGTTVSWQVGNYYSSDNLQIYGLLCTPTSLTGRYPVAILNHGLTIATGWPAIQGPAWTGCTTMAGSGWLTAITTYRGETISQLPAPYGSFTATSGGFLEMCAGEVDDVLNLLSAVTALPIANPQQVFMWGHSHGSCITELAIERGAPVQVAVSLDGPTDFTTWSHDPWWVLGNPAAQDARSSVYYGNNPAALGGANLKFLRIHAEGDAAVELQQGCELAEMLPGSSNYYLNSALTPPGVYYGSPKACANYWWVPWKSGQLLPDEVGGTWPSPTVLVYSGLDHSAIREKSWPEWASFVNEVAQSRGWPAAVPSSYAPFEN
jgi:hypothetical protein